MKNNIVIILASGKSKRMIFKKTNLFIKKDIIIEHYKKYIKQKTYINSKIKIYNNIPDIIPNIGPVGALYTTIKYIQKNTNILLLSIDMPIISKKIIKLLYNWKKKYKIINYNKINFPNLIQMNKKNYENLNKNIKIYEYIKKKISVQNFIKKIKRKKIFYKIRKKLFTNINNKKIWINIKKIIEKENKFIFQI